ncbi:MASE1 domain-containing protein [Xanthomonas sp. AmX2]|uniref:MASE1 domain-containing protein n=1 Tax=Xanthomonas sp. TaxID=29446 RepID=UPI001980228A|nr:MASE1 domain-containing protein [Xanthomonas sp.]MBN6152145.1 MASE1 domain-containing protein [Xanthomonas sp.]
MATLKKIAGGILLSAGYCALYMLVWRWSVDQWFLPAGVRAAALLFLPYRLWPYVLLGDAAALLAMRVPMANHNGVSELWAYLSPFLVAPLFALLPWTFRSRFPASSAVQRWLPLLTVGLAVWGLLVNKAVNAMLEGPAAFITLEHSVRYGIGSYLGILMFVLPTLLWLRRKADKSLPSKLLRDCAIAVLAVAGIFALAMATPGLLHQFILLMLLVPGVWLTLSHGWRGSAVGVVLANLAVAMSLPRSNYAGAYDQQGFDVQMLIAVAATILFVLGSKISSAFRQARHLGYAEQQALQVAQASYMSAERTLRNRVIEYTDIHTHLNKLSRDIASSLKERGHYAAAMEMNRTGVIQTQLLDDYVAALYPLDIETQGLYGALKSIAFANACDTEVETRLRGESRQLSIGLQLAAYRCVLNAMEMLPRSGRHRITARVWKGRGRRGLLVTIAADPALLLGGSASKSVDEIEWELASRLKAHDGLCRRRHELKISFLVSEPSERRPVTS